MDQNQSYQPGQQGYQQGGYQQGGYQQGYGRQGYQQGYQGGYGYQRQYVESSTNNPFNCGPEGKSRGVFALLALVFGSIGLQYFYVNKFGAALITILLMLVSCGAWSIINLIQGVIMLWSTTNEEFDRKFVASNNTYPLF
jgi:TM2 domain-containing membrane protein YozV